MSRKDTLNSIFMGKPSAATPSEQPAPKAERVRSGAVGALGTSLQELTQGARAAAKLQEQLNAGDQVVLVDPALIDPSPIADRLPVENDPGFDALVDSIRAFGQQVPILVRPHPTVEGRYQIAYGRRRLKALSQIGVKAKAIIRRLGDDEMVVAQGRENLDREDLSFIEKALFARRLEDAGYERTVIMAALSTDKADLSRYIAIARRVPEDVARRIGPARKTGRARWSSLVEALDGPKTSERIDDVVASGKFAAADSDGRFALVLASVSASVARPVRSSAWATPEGRRAAKIEKKAGQTAITFDEKRVPEFGAFVAGRLDALYRDFLQQEGKDESDR